VGGNDSLSTLPWKVCKLFFFPLNKCNSIASECFSRVIFSPTCSSPKTSTIKSGEIVKDSPWTFTCLYFHEVAIWIASSLSTLVNNWRKGNHAQLFKSPWISLSTSYTIGLSGVDMVIKLKGNSNCVTKRLPTTSFNRMRVACKMPVVEWLWCLINRGLPLMTTLYWQLYQILNEMPKCSFPT